MAEKLSFGGYGFVAHRESATDGNETVAALWKGPSNRTANQRAKETVFGGKPCALLLNCKAQQCCDCLHTGQYMGTAARCWDLRTAHT